MKKIFLCTVILLPGMWAVSQNVGINTTTPGASLDVRGNQRFGGFSKYLSYDSASGKFVWSNSYLFVPSPQYLMQHSASAEGLYYANAQLEYRNSGGSPVFFTNWNSGNGYFGNNLGIGTANPLTKLHVFNGASGNTTPFSPLVVEGSSNSYINLLTPNGSESGLLFGKQNNAASGGIVYNNGDNLNGLQFRTNGNNTKMVISSGGNVGIGGGQYSPPSTLDVFRGTGPYGTATFRGTTHITHFNHDVNEDTYIRDGKNSSNVNINDLVGLGNVGIGNNNPGYKLDVSNRMRIRSGGNNTNSAGIWFNNNANSEAAFIGMEDDTHIGLFGNGGAYWKFSMNTNTGALKVNGSEGQTGQVLSSNGGNANTWISPTNFIYNNIHSFTQTGNVTFTNYAAVPGLNQTINTPKCKAVMILKGIMDNAGCFGCGEHDFKFDLVVDNVLIDRSISAVGNGAEAIVTNGALVYELSAGSHNIVVNVDGNNSTFTATSFRLVILLFPE